MICSWLLIFSKLNKRKQHPMFTITMVTVCRPHPKLANPLGTIISTPIED